MMKPFTFNTTPSLRMGAGLAGQIGEITRRYAAIGCFW
jgi:hypothetical protein